MRADERIAAMHDSPDVLAQKRLEQAQKEAEESKRQFEELEELLA
jgi:hypothetical protein